MSTAVCILLFVLGCSSAVPRGDLYPFGTILDLALPSDVDDVSSLEVQLTVPIVFYDNAYKSVFVNDNGLISFLTEVPSFFNAQFPLSYPIIAPLYCDVDTRGTGAVYYRETKAQDLLDRAAKEVQRHFVSGAEFFPHSLFIATWDQVGHYNRKTSQVNTFQAIIASNGTDSYALFLYPEDGIQWIQSDGKNLNYPDARAQAGFMAGDSRLYTISGSGTDQARNFDKMSNVQKPGFWAFHIGQVGVDRNIGPADLNVGLGEEALGTQTCGNAQVPCPPTSICIDYETGFCCACSEDYFGNGRNCMKKGNPQRMNGKVKGIINDVPLDNVDLHAYIVTDDGRTYTAISRVAPSIGYDMQSLTTMGGIIGWLFAVSRGGAKNGFMITGGAFNRTVEVDFPQSGHHVLVAEEYLGPDVFNYMKVNVELRGSLPSIPYGAKIEVGDYEEEYTRVSPGLIKSHSSRSYRLEGNALETPFVLHQTISYTECPHALVDPQQDTTRLKVARNFIVYDNREQIVRFAATNKVSHLSIEDPCKTGKFQCGPNSKCVVEADNFRCICDRGYEYLYEEDVNGERATCVDVNECAAGNNNCHIYADCVNLPGSFACRCLPGFIGNGLECKKTPTCSDLLCGANSECIPAASTELGAVCQCRQGYEGDGFTCRPVVGPLPTAECTSDDTCDRNAACAYDPVSGKNHCQCLPGYAGNGLICIEETETCNFANDCHPDAKCLYDEGSYYCACNPGFSGDGYRCTPEGFQSCNEINTCHPHAQCIYVGGQYRCQCNVGYTGNGYQCSKSHDVSCNEVNICSVHARCVYDPYVSKHICQCSDGYDGDGTICTPIDECNTGEDCHPNAQCVYDSISQRYRCQCNLGFVGSGKFCNPTQDVACNLVNNCHQNARCIYDTINLRYHCQCDPGYQGDGLNCRPAFISCNIINNCDAYADCLYDTLTEGYRCRCKEGYDGDGYRCRPMRSCREDTYLCHTNADCIRRENVGDYICQCRSGYVGDGIHCRIAPQHESNFLLFGQGMSVLKMPLTPNKYSKGTLLVMEPHQTVVGIDVDCLNGHIYWTDVSQRVIRRATYNGSGTEIVVASDMWSPEGIAVDWVSKNIYWTDSLKDTIEVAKTDGTNHKVLFKDDLVNPRGIVVHPGIGKMYWTDWNRKAPKIETASMDGTARSVLVADSLALPNMLAIDFERNNLCWTDAGLQRIECIDLNGHNRQVVYSPATYPFDLTLAGGKIYWTDWEIKFIQRVDRNGGTPDFLELPLGGNGKLYGIRAVLSQCPRVSNACANQNGGCQNLCLPNIHGGRTCVCPDADEDGEVSCNEI